MLLLFTAIRPAWIEAESFRSTDPSVCPGRCQGGWAALEASRHGSDHISRVPLLSRLPGSLLRHSRTPWAGPLCSVALVLALPLATGQLPGPDLLKGLLPGIGTTRQELGGNGISGSSSSLANQDLVNQAFRSGAVSAYRITPERRALLNTIRFAEGTWTNGRGDGYRMLFGGGQFRDLARHPELVVSRGYSSAAAGAYQFLPGTWDEAARRLKLPDFQPASQDQAALYLVEKRGALARFDRQGLSHDVVALLAQEWSSLPTLQGGSYYGQPVKGVEELRRFYSEELARQRTKTV